MKAWKTEGSSKAVYRRMRKENKALRLLLNLGLTAPFSVGSGVRR